MIYSSLFDRVIIGPILPSTLLSHHCGFMRLPFTFSLSSSICSKTPSAFALSCSGAELLKRYRIKKKRDAVIEYNAR